MANGAEFPTILNELEYACADYNKGRIKGLPPITMKAYAENIAHIANKLIHAKHARKDYKIRSALKGWKKRKEHDTATA